MIKIVITLLSKKNQANDYFFIILMLILYLCIFIHLNLSSKHIILYL